jgi:hypothetical protein
MNMLHCGEALHVTALQVAYTVSIFRSKKTLFGSVGTSFVCIRNYGIQLRLGYYGTYLMIIVRTRPIIIASILLSPVGGGGSRDKFNLINQIIYVLSGEVDARWPVYQHEFPLPNPAGEHQGCRTLHMQRRQRSWTGKTLNIINYKDTKTKCRLCLCLIESIDWRFSQSC